MGLFCALVYYDTRVSFRDAFTTSLGGKRSENSFFGWICDLFGMVWVGIRLSALGFNLGICLFLHCLL